MMTPAPKPRLGRGLSALLGDLDPSIARVSVPPATTSEPTPPAANAVAARPEGSSQTGLKLMPIAHLRRNPDQPRKRFDEAELEELAASIRENGLIQPIIARPIPGVADAYQIVAGERRWRAAQKVGLHEVPVVVREYDDQEVLQLSIIENVQRADLNPIEEARGYKALVDQFGHTQEEIAKVIGKSRSHVANMLRLLELPPRVRDLVYESKLTAGHARAIMTTPDPEGLALRIIKENLSVRDAEALARGAHEEAGEGGANRGGRPPTKDADTLALEKDVAAALGLDVDIRHRGESGGELRIRYSQLDQLQDVCKRLQRGGP